MVGWIPALDEEITAWSAQAARVDNALESASALVDASSKLLDAYLDAQNTLLNSESEPSTSPPDIDALEPIFAAAVEDVAHSSSLGRKYKPAIHMPPTRNALTLVEEIEDTMLAASRIGQQASGLLSQLLDIRGSVEPLMAQFALGGGETDRLSVEELRATLAELDDDLQFAHVRASGMVKLASESELSGRFLSELDLLQQILGVLLIVNRGTMVGLDAVGLAVDASQGSGSGLLGSDGTIARVLSRVREREDEFEATLPLLENAELTVRELKSRDGGSRYRRGLDELDSAVSQLRQGLQLLRDIAPIGERLIGVGTTRRYLVLGHSADELRATGGFVSAAWLVTFENGALADIKYHDIVRVDSPDRYLLYPPAPSGLEEHMFAHVWLLRDVSWEPDFPTTAQTAADMYRLGQQQEVDGVVALNQWALLSFLEGVRSIPSPGGGDDITSRNLLAKLEAESDEHGRAYMDLTLQGILDRFTRPMPLSALMRTTWAMHKSLQERDLMLFLRDPALQEVIGENQWDGRVRQEPTDYLYVVDSNVGWSKADRNIERQVRYRVDLTKQSRPRIHLTLSYNNHSGPSSASCDPQWYNEDGKYPNLKNACYWNFWRVYLPMGARLLSSTPAPLPEYSVSVLIGKGQPGEDTVGISSSYNKTVLSGLFDLAAGELREINLVYDLPPRLLTRNGDDIEYKILLQKQPGIRWRDVTLEFSLPPGYHLASSSAVPDFSRDSQVSFSLRIKQDTLIDAIFTKRGNDPS